MRGGVASSRSPLPRAAGWRYEPASKMKTVVHALACSALICACHTGAQPTTRTNDLGPWSRDQRPDRPFTSADARKLPLIQVKGNQFVDPEGKPVLLRGRGPAL